jgi:hypothetical protein
MSPSKWPGFAFAVLAWGCSAGGSSRSLVVGNEGTGGSSTGPAGSGGTSISLTGDASTSKALSARIESPPGVTVSFVTLSCTEKCADVVAVASGGFGSYSFRWEDGSTAPGRRVCPTAKTDYEVTVTDEGVTSGEIRRAPQTVTAPLTANVIACPADAGAPRADSGPTTRCAPYRVFAAVPSGFSPSGPAVAGFATTAGAPLVVIAQGSLPTHSLDPECSHLYLAGDAAGTLPVAFDNGLLAEVRAAPGDPVIVRSYYGTDTLTFNGQPVPSLLAPSVPGLAVGILGPGNFGYPPLAIDLATDVATHATFDLTLTVIDSGGFGSTTEVWVVAR